MSAHLQHHLTGRLSLRPPQAESLAKPTDEAIQAFYEENKEGFAQGESVARRFERPGSRGAERL